MVENWTLFTKAAAKGKGLLRTPSYYPAAREIATDFAATPQDWKTVGVDVYIASPLGFSPATGPFYSHLLAELRGAGIRPLDPWENVGPVATALEINEYEVRQKALRDANTSIGRENVALLDRAAAVLAILDGPDVDSGTAAEIGWAAARSLPIVGWRGDLRATGDNEGAVINIQVEYFIRTSGGLITRDLQMAIRAVANLAEKGTASRNQRR